MKPTKIICHLFWVVCAIATVSCVDDSFRLDNISTEVTVGTGTTVVPLGYFDDKSIAELLGDEEIKGLEIDENGNLSFVYADEGDDIEIGGVVSSFNIDEIVNNFQVEYPQFDLDMYGVVIDEKSDIYVDLGELDNFTSLPVIPGLDLSDYEYYIPEGVELPTIYGSFYKEFAGDDMNLELDIPEQIKNVNKVIFRDVEDKHKGAPMRLSVQFNDIADINGGGNLWFDLKVSGGSFTILNADNEVIYVGDHFNDEYVIEPGVGNLDFVIYVESVINDARLDENNHLDIPLVLTYDMKFEVKAKPGSFSIKRKPHLELFADFEFGDAEVEVNTEDSLFEYVPDKGTTFVIKDLPAAVKSLNGVSIMDGTSLGVYAKGLEWLDEYADKLEVAVKLPTFLEIKQKSGADYKYDKESGVLRANLSALNRGLEIEVEGLDFGSNGISPNAYGDIELEFAPSINVYFVDDSTIMTSSLMHEGMVDVTVGVEPMTLEIVSVNGKVDYDYNINQTFELEGLRGHDIEVVGVGVKPVIMVNITNPLTIPATIDASVTPSLNGVPVEKNKVSVYDIPVEPATYLGGVITDAKTTLVIADESLADEYSDSKYTFIAKDVTKMFLGDLPDSFDLSISLSVDSSIVQEVYIDDSFVVEYDYSINVPLAVDQEFEVKYSGKTDGLKDIFADVAGYDVKVGDIAFIATVSNSTPLELGANVTLLDVDGNPTEAQVFIEDNASIQGSEDGVTVAESVLRLVVDLGEDGSVANVTAIDGIRFDLVGKSAANELSVPLNEKQTIGLKLQLELAGGITVDVMDFMGE